MKKIVCINLQGAGIPDYISEHLLLTSSNMFMNRVDFTKFQGGTYEGKITTKFRQINIGFLSGIEFFAVIEWELDGSTRKTQLKYSVEPETLSSSLLEYSVSTVSLEEFETMLKNAC